MALLDLLGTAFSSELSGRERQQVRSLLQQQVRRAPAAWESGVVTRPAPTRTPEEVLRERVEDLELTVKVLCDLLIERGTLESGALPGRVATIQAQLAAEEDAKEDAERARAEAARAAAEARTVACAGCGGVVRERTTFLSSRGPLCAPCHAAADE